MKKVLYSVLIIALVVAFSASGLYLWYYFAQARQDQARFDQLAAQRDAARASAVAAQAATEATEATAAPAETTAATTPAAPVVSRLNTVETAAADKSVDASNPYGTPGEAGHANEYYTPEEVTEEDATPVKDDSTGDLLPWYQELHEQNSDMVGWITIEGTQIDYPVMQSSKDQPNYYLYRNFDKEQSVRGCIYAAESCDVAAPSDNITLFGHNMKDGSMFAALGKYSTKSEWEKNSLIFFDTLTESHVYKIFAVFKTSGTDGVGFAYHLMADAEDETEFDEFVAACKKLSFYDTGITPAYGDKLICLSTCEYTLDNGRFVVAAVRIT